MSAAWERSTSSKRHTLQTAVLAKSHCERRLSGQIIEHNQFDKPFKKKKKTNPEGSMHSTDGHQLSWLDCTSAPLNMDIYQEPHNTRVHFSLLLASVPVTTPCGLIPSWLFNRPNSQSAYSRLCRVKIRISTLMVFVISDITSITVGYRYQPGIAASYMTAQILLLHQFTACNQETANCNSFISFCNHPQE